MTTQPAWSSVDDDTADLLTLVADDGRLCVDEEWNLYVRCLRSAASSFGVIDPNLLRQVIGGRIKSQRVGAFTHRALSAGVVEYTGQYVTSTDTRGRNGGKPCRQLRWIGDES